MLVYYNSRAVIICSLQYLNIVNISNFLLTKTCVYMLGNCYQFKIYNKVKQIYSIFTHH